MKPERSAGPVITAVLLSYTSGFVDTLSFIALFGLFAAHVTGNFVLIATSLAEFRHGLWMKLLAIPVFVLSAVCTRMFIIRRERGQRDAAVQVLAGQATLLTLFMVLATKNAPLKDHNDTIVIVIGLIASASMAIQNTAARTFLSHLPPTTVMTGNMIQIIVDLVDLAHGHEVEVKRARLAKLFPLLLAFIVGTLSGGAGYVTVGFPSLIVPIAAIVALCSLLWRHHPVSA
jgi:uncharacterized membrane protein YoaK (UPF0700 family)